MTGYVCKVLLGGPPARALYISRRLYKSRRLSGGHDHSFGIDMN
jgi:hypothetical protein